jgi:molecular chaperone DnaK (HSP70)
MNAFSDFLNQRASTQSVTEPARVLGIDLGTTNSTAAELTWSPGQAVPQPGCVPIDQPTEEGVYTHVLLPSQVACLPDRVLIGEGAKRLRTRSSELDLERGRALFWDCKNDIGLQRTYNRAPPGYRSAREIAGHVLRFLMDAVRAENDAPFDRVVVTVPASFQTAQRRDTIEAGRLAQIELVGGDLVDEPVAAFLDYGFTYGLEELGSPGQSRNLLVFDFGGGTCDVAIFTIRLPKTGEGPQIAPRAVSRYHRLGGGDIDAAIVHEVLLPQIREQNHLGEFELSFKEKKHEIEPSFLGVAEALKISLCKEITRLHKFGRYEEAPKDSLVVKNPGVHYCPLKDGRTLSLQSPSLSAADFLKLLQPFLDPDVLATRENEYRLTCSIFAPLTDALERSRLHASDIDLCLLVGGSSLILRVQQALQDFFPKARMLTYEDQDAVQTAVARGGAYHASLLAATGKGMFQPIISDAILIQTDKGPVELIHQHAPLPYPGGGKRWAENHRLKVPRSSREKPVDLRIELTDSQGVYLARFAWVIPPPVRKGDPLLLQYRMDENQLLEMKLSLATGENTAAFDLTLENPLTYVVNPSKARVKIDQLEEDLRTGKLPKAEWPDRIAELAALYEDLGQLEKAFELLKNAVRARGTPSTYLLNRMGLVCDYMGDYERAERFYREATKLGRDGAPLFNLALSYKRRGIIPNAVAAVREALERGRQAPYLVLQAQLAESVKDTATRTASLNEANSLFGGLAGMSDWELWWFKIGATMQGDQENVQRAEEERRRRDPKGSSAPAGDLPNLNAE